MDLFDETRYRMNVNFLRVLGLWPFQPKTQILYLNFFWGLVFLSISVPMVHRSLTDFSEQVIVTNITSVLIIALSLSKWVTTILTANEIKKLSELMQDEWSRYKSGPTYDIMMKYANDGYKYTIFYCLLMYNSMIVYLLIPMRLKIMEWLHLIEGPVEYAFPFYVDYWVDSNEYVFWIQIHIILATTFVISLVVGPDIVFLLYVQHACGVFSAICNRLENVPTISNFSCYIDKDEDEAFRVISDCIEQHNRAINFSEVLENTYSWSFFCTICLNTINLTFTGIQILVHFDDISEVMRLAPFIISQAVYICVETTISQQLMDCSGQVAESIKMMKWYAISLRSQKLLNLMTIRSRVVNKITAGKIFVMSMEFFGAVVKTSMTYFTLVRSMKEE